MTSSVPLRLGQIALAAGLLELVGWLVVHNVARRMIRAKGLPRFMAGCLLAGYLWLAVAGAIWVLVGGATEGPAYDAVIHAVSLGFTMSMIMAHAPVILPIVLRCRLPYHPVMTAAPVLLHTSLILRLAVGDARSLDIARQIGGGLNVDAMLESAVITAGAAIRAGHNAARVSIATPAIPAVATKVPASGSPPASGADAEWVAAT